MPPVYGRYVMVISTDVDTPRRTFALPHGIGHVAAGHVTDVAFLRTSEDRSAYVAHGERVADLFALAELVPWCDFDELRHAREITREVERQARHHTDMSRSPIVLDSTRLPERIKVPFLAAIPLDGERIRLDESQAVAVTQHADGAIGMDDAIGDQAARAFAAQFYSSFGFGHPIETAFEQAKAALIPGGSPEESTPVLFTRSAVEAAEVVLVRQQPPHDRTLTDRRLSTGSGSGCRRAATA